MTKKKSYSLEYFRKMGVQGAKAAMKAMSAEERKERARKAAEARWNKRKEKGL